MLPSKFPHHTIFSTDYTYMRTTSRSKCPGGGSSRRSPSLGNPNGRSRGATTPPLGVCGGLSLQISNQKLYSPVKQSPKLLLCVWSVIEGVSLTLHHDQLPLDPHSPQPLRDVLGFEEWHLTVLRSVYNKRRRPVLRNAKLGKQPNIPLSNHLSRLCKIQRRRLHCPR